MRKFEFITPQSEINEVNDEYGMFTITPLERGYGLTIGNALRRVLLSSMPGVAIVAMEIQGVQNEFQAIPGVKEDVTEIVLNLKNIKLTIDESELLKASDNVEIDVEDLYKLSISRNKKGVITAGDLVHDERIKVVNPEQVVATLTKDINFDATFFARRGIGYVSAEENTVFCQDKDEHIYQERIAIDSIYTPVNKVRYDVEKTRVNKDPNYDKLTIEIWVDGRITAVGALALASKFLSQHFNKISAVKEKVLDEDYMYEQEEIKVSRDLEKPIEQLDLSVRAYNCLKREKITTVGELVQKTVEEMMHISGFGRTSFKEVQEKLTKLGLSFKKQADELKVSADRREE